MGLNDYGVKEEEPFYLCIDSLGLTSLLPRKLKSLVSPSHANEKPVAI